MPHSIRWNMCQVKRNVHLAKFPAKVYQCKQGGQFFAPTLRLQSNLAIYMYIAVLRGFLLFLNVKMRSECQMPVYQSYSNEIDTVVAQDNTGVLLKTFCKV